jgi:hypothetical protein
MKNKHIKLKFYFFIILQFVVLSGLIMHLSKPISKAYYDSDIAMLLVLWIPIILVLSMIGSLIQSYILKMKGKKT